jgi:hypothetical protein
MYTRASAFGPPILGSNGGGGMAVYYAPSFAHITPPYFAGVGTATFAFTPEYDGVPTLDEILAGTAITYTRDELTTNTLYTANPKVNVDDSFNLTGYYSDPNNDGTTLDKRWLIQSKFETPVLNFANVSSSSPQSSSCASAITNPADIKTTGMWHQYGNIPTGSNEGIFAVIDDLRTAGSLADVVGFPTGEPLRIGRVRDEQLLEEAVVVIPFKRVKNRKQFFEFNEDTRKTDSYEAAKNAVKKYVFPPKLDFVKNKRLVTPVVMYIFEFSAKVTQKDLADMWQNLPPDMLETFEQKEVVVHDKDIINSLLDSGDNIEWMVFKVKKRAQKSYEKYRRTLVTDNTDILDNISDYTYNWPYDYFSLVELIKIDESVQYTSVDLTNKADLTTQILGDVNVNITNPVPVINVDDNFDG